MKIVAMKFLSHRTSMISLYFYCSLYLTCGHFTDMNYLMLLVYGRSVTISKMPWYNVVSYEITEQKNVSGQISSYIIMYLDSNACHIFLNTKNSCYYTTICIEICIYIVETVTKHFIFCVLPILWHPWVIIDSSNLQISAGCNSVSKPKWMCNCIP